MGSFYACLAADLIEDIRAGKIAPGAAVPSMRSLARKGYIAKCSGRYYQPMAMATAQRARRLVDSSGMVTASRPHSGRRTLVLPEAEWQTAASIS